MADSKVEFAGLRVRYGRREALKGVTFDARHHEILGIIGPAQSGKTTLLSTINRTIDNVPGAVVAGTVRLDGQDLRDLTLDSISNSIGRPRSLAN